MGGHLWCRFVLANSSASSKSFSSGVWCGRGPCTVLSLFVLCVHLLAVSPLHRQLSVDGVRL